MQNLNLASNQLKDININNNHVLQTLNLANNKLSDGVSMSNNPVLQTVNLENNQLTSKGIKEVAENKSSIVTLNVNHNSVGDGIAAFKTSTVLQALYARDNAIHAAGAKGIAQVPSLATLDISSNHIENEGAVLIAQNKHINNLELEHTKIGTETVDALLKNENLTNVKTCFRDVGPVNKFRLWNFVKENNADPKKHALF